MCIIFRGTKGDSRPRSKSSRASRRPYRFEAFPCVLDAAYELIEYHQSSRLSEPTDALRNVCLRRIARVRLGVIYRGGLSECQKYCIIIPRVRAFAPRTRRIYNWGISWIASGLSIVTDYPRSCVSGIDPCIILQSASRNGGALGLVAPRTRNTYRYLSIFSSILPPYFASVPA